MKRILLILVICLILSQLAFSQDLKEQAKELYEKQDYTKAVEILRAAKVQNPDDAEIYYLLGHYLHYMAYDSKPLIEYDSAWSDQVIEYLEKAIDLSEEYYGDAWYFLGAEYGARAMKKLAAGDFTGYKKEYKTAYKKGCYPKWYIEYGRNLLKSCDQNSILFVMGDFQYNSTQVVQFIEAEYQNISVIPMGSILGRPWYANMLARHDKYGPNPVKFRWNEKELKEIRPYKWDEITILVPVDSALASEFGVNNFDWTIEPDLKSSAKTYLSPWAAVFVEIIDANGFNRPVFVTYGWQSEYYCGLYGNTQDYGIVRKLLPVKTGAAISEINQEKVEEFVMNLDNFKDFKSVDNEPMPRIQGMLRTYQHAAMKLIASYQQQGNKEKTTEVYEYLQKNLMSKEMTLGN